MDSQFSLSLELSKITPPVLEHGRQVLIETVKALQTSGSNFMTEAQLAAVFGRTLIHPQFANKFRRLVGPSTSYNFSSFLRLVLEQGPGPTIKHAFEKGNDAYFSMVVQVSMLSFVYRVPDLSTALSRAFEGMALKDSPDVPRYENLLPTIRCIAEQCCRFDWELWLVSTQAQLQSDLDLQCLREWGAPSYAILAGLIETLPLLYRFPETYLLEIQTMAGVSMIVVWANELLGLSVEVRYRDRTKVFGNQPPVSFIDCLYSGFKTQPDLVLFKETKGVRAVEWTKSEDRIWDPELSLTSRHTSKGYGTKCLNSYNSRQTRPSQLSLDAAVAYIAIRSCRLAYILLNTSPVVNIPEYCLSVGRTSTTLSYLFPSCEGLCGDLATASSVGDEEGLKSATRFSALEPEIPFWQDSWIYQTICKVVIALCSLTDIKSCESATLGADDIATLSQIRDIDDIKSMQDAFRVLGILLAGEYSEEHDCWAVASGWGWSICVNSLINAERSRLSPTISLIQGVPALSGERKRLVLDHRLRFDYDNALDDLPYRLLANGNKDPAQLCTLQSELVVHATSYMVGVTGDSFTILKTAKLGQRGGNPFPVRLGLRFLQNVYWNVSHLPACECAKKPRIGDTFNPGRKTWVFDGFVGSMRICDAEGRDVEPSEDPWELTTNPSHELRGLAAKLAVSQHTPEELWQQRQRLNETLPLRDPECRVHLALTAGNSLARYFLLARLQWQRAQTNRRGRRRNFAGIFLRHDDCCISCGVKHIRGLIQGDNVAYAHACMIS